MVIEKFVRGLNRLIKIIFWELVIRPIRIPKLENLSCKIFNGESAVYSEGLLKEFSEKANWFRGAVYPQFPASFAAQEVERRNFYNFLEGICRRNFTDKLGLTELEIVIFSWLWSRGYDGREELLEKGRKHLVPAVISLVQHFGGDPFQHYSLLREKYKKLELM